MVKPCEGGTVFSSNDGCEG